jgi:hypothetical protein
MKVKKGGLIGRSLALIAAVVAVSCESPNPSASVGGFFTTALHVLEEHAPERAPTYVR